MMKKALVRKAIRNLSNAQLMIEFISFEINSSRWPLDRSKLMRKEIMAEELTRRLKDWLEETPS